MATEGTCRRLPEAARTSCLLAAISHRSPARQALGYRPPYERRCRWTFQLVMSIPGRAWAISENQLRYGRR